MNKLLMAVIVIAALIIGASVSYFAFPKEVSHDVIIEKNVTVEKIVTEVVTVDKNADLLSAAIKEYKAELADDDSYLVVDGNQYDLEQVTFKDVKNVQINVDSSNRKDTVTVVSFDQPLKFTDSVVDTKAYRTDSVEVTFHSDAREDTEISIN